MFCIHINIMKRCYYTKFVLSTSKQKKLINIPIDDGDKRGDEATYHNRERKRGSGGQKIWSSYST